MYLSNANLKNIKKVKKLSFINSSSCLASYTSTQLEWPINKVRDTYLDFFCKKNSHKFIKSSTVLPKKGSGTYFTNAGMNQFKSIILGETDVNKIIDFKKYIGAANSQKCIRIGGKHNDLEDIGKDTYHHTFFEMLGNWSFNGSYSHEKACELALNLLVDHYKLNINGLYFTYFSGSKDHNLKSDLDTKNIWLKLGIPERQILPFDMKANFWEMDIVGPCGPCTEIHYDRNVNNIINNQLELNKARDLVNAGTERVIELWNIVFMNYNRINKTKFTQLQNPVIDTGMGLERLTAVLNSLSSNYDSDAFQPLFSTIYDHSKNNGLKEYKFYNFNDPISISYRTLSDYMRSITISISDGLMPSRNGLGGFLKYLILNSLKIARNIFKVENDSQLICELVSNVVDNLKYAYPELANRKSYIQEVIRHTYERQKQKQVHWDEITDRFLKKLPNNTNKLTGEQTWKLFKGDGSGDEVSIEFIQKKLEEKQIDIDMDGFNKLYLMNNEKALKNQKNIRIDMTSFIEIASLIKHLPKTDDSFKYLFDLETNKHDVIFRQSQPLKANILSIAVQDKDKKKYKLVDQISNTSEDYLIVLDRTNFYSESGGQASDKGILKCLKNNHSFEVKNCYNIQGYTFHIGKLIDSNARISLNDEIECHVDTKSRYNTTLNHSGVHLLNQAIRQAYEKEDSIIQVQSSVKSDSFKFEFKLNQIVPKPDSNKIKLIQDICQNIIDESLPVYINDNVEFDEEKLNSLIYPVRKLNDFLYPNRVRVFSIGAKWDEFLSNDKNQPNKYYSAEFCCGTHISNTKQLDKMLITHLEVIGDSSFEIQATTGQNTLKIIENDERVLSYLNEMKEIYLEPNSPKYQEMNSHEKLKYLNELADLSADIENIFKNEVNSYFVQQKIKLESSKYRPSRNMLQNALKKHFEDELIEDSTVAVNAAVIAKINEKPSLSIKFLAFNSILYHDSILNILHKIDKLHPAIIIYNSKRECYYYYSKYEIENNKSLEEFFNQAQTKILETNKNASLIETGKHYRIIKCPMAVSKSEKSIKKSYFNF